MSDPSLAMQGAIVAGLNASSALATAMGGTANVFDTVPAEPPHPYVRVGQDQAIGNDTGCAAGWEFFATLHVFARPIPGLGAIPLAKRIGGPVRAVLVALEDAQLTGFKVDEAQFRSADYFMERDGVTAHGVITCRFLITESA